MIDRETLPEYDWHVMLRDGSTFTVRAAYPQYGLSSVNPESKPPLVLKDSANKVVFLAPEDAVGCVERRARLDESSDDLEETGELQAEVDRLRAQLAVRTPSTGTWTWPGTVTYNFPTMGAAGVGSTYVVPAPGSAGEGGTEGDDGTTGVPVA